MIRASGTDMQAALAGGIGLYRADVARRRSWRDDPDGIDLSCRRNGKMTYKDMTFAGFIPQESPGSLR